MIDWISPLLTTLIAAFVAYVAWQQYKTAKTKLKLDLFDRRYKVWQTLQDFLGTIIRDADMNDDALRKFVVGTGDAEFLFKDEVPDYLHEVRERAVNLRYWN